MTASRRRRSGPQRAKMLLGLTGGLVAALFVVLSARGASGQTATSPQVDESASGAPYVAGELLVTYDGSLKGAPTKSVAGSVGGTVEKNLPAVDSQLLALPKVKSKSDRRQRENLLADARHKLQSDPSVAAVDYNYIREPAAVPNDPFYREQWDLPKVSAPLAWNRSTGKGASIAVIDTGVDSNHPDLAGKIVRSAGFSGDGTVTEGAAEDPDGHGTQVSGVAAAATNNKTGVAGVCPDCSLMEAKVIDGRGRITSAAIVSAINWATANKASVINISLASDAPSYSATEQAAVDNAWNSRVTVVAAAGNSGSSVESYPAAYDHVVSVAATTRQDTRAYYSNYGPWVDVSAPGGSSPTTSDGILSTILGGGYGPSLGTSLASPLVAGEAGLLAGEGLSNAQAVQRIERTAADLGPAGRDDFFGYGRVDAAAATGAEQQNVSPRITRRSPKPLSRVDSIRVVVRATVKDDRTDLKKGDISFFVDGRRRYFTYDSATDRLSSTQALAPGRHRVRVAATDGQGLGKASAWSFTVRKPADRV